MAIWNWKVLWDVSRIPVRQIQGKFSGFHFSLIERCYDNIMIIKESHTTRMWRNKKFCKQFWLNEDKTLTWVLGGDLVDKLNSFKQTYLDDPNEKKEDARQVYSEITEQRWGSLCFCRQHAQFSFKDQQSRWVNKKYIHTSPDVTHQFISTSL